MTRETDHRDFRLKQAGVLDVTARGALPVQDGTMQVSFSTACGAALRLRMPVADALKLSRWLSGYLDGVQSPMSSEMPKVDGSPQEGVQQ